MPLAFQINEDESLVVVVEEEENGGKGVEDTELWANDRATLHHCTD